MASEIKDKSDHLVNDASHQDASGVDSSLAENASSSFEEAPQITKDKGNDSSEVTATDPSDQDNGDQNQSVTENAQTQSALNSDEQRTDAFAKREPDHIPNHASLVAEEVNENTSNAEVLVSNDLVAPEGIATRAPTVLGEVNETTSNAEVLVSNNVTSTSEEANRPLPALTEESNLPVSYEGTISSADLSKETKTERVSNESDQAAQSAQGYDELPSKEDLEDTTPVSSAIANDELPIPNVAEPVEQSESAIPKAKVEIAKEKEEQQVSTFLEDVKDESIAADREPQPTFLEEIQQNAVENDADHAKLPFEAASSEPTFLEQLQLQDTKTDATSSQQEGAKVNEQIASEEYPLVVEDKHAKVELEATEQNLIAENDEEHSEPTFLEEIQQEESNAETGNGEVHLKVELKATEQNLTAKDGEEHSEPTFLDEIQQEESNAELENGEEPNFLAEIQAKANEAEPAKETSQPQNESTHISEDNAPLPWEEPATKSGDTEEPDAFDFLNETTNDSFTVGEKVEGPAVTGTDAEKADDAESVKSFSFLEEDFEPLLEDQVIPEKTVTSYQPTLSGQNPYARGASYVPQQAVPTVQKTLKPKKSFFEELPLVSETARLTKPAKSNPYAAIVQQAHQMPLAPVPNHTQAAPAPVAPPKNPYAPSAAALKAQQENALQTPKIPQPLTAKDSLAQTSNAAPQYTVSHYHLTSSTNPQISIPPRSASRASSVASKSFFEELPVLSSPAAKVQGTTPKNPYAPMVHQNHLGPTMGAPPQANPYGISHSSHRRLSSHGSLPPNAGHRPSVSHTLGSGAMPTSPMQQQSYAQHQAYQGPPHAYTGHNAQQLGAPNYGTSANNFGNRSRTSSHAPQPQYGAQSQNYAIDGLISGTHSVLNISHQGTALAPPANSNGGASAAASPKASKYAPHTYVKSATQKYASPNAIYAPQPQQHVQMSPVTSQFFQNQTPAALGPPYEQRGPQNYMKAAKIPDNFQVPPNIEFTRQFPILNFNRTKKVAKVVLPGSVYVVDSDSLSELSELEKSFGPLSKSKTKKLTVESWISEKKTYVSQNDPSNIHLSLILTILKELVKGDGIIQSKAPIIEELSKTARLEIPQGTSFSRASYATAKESLPKDATAFGLFNYLQEGKKEEALQYLVAQKEWPLSFIVATLVNPESVLSVVNQYLLDYFSDEKSNSTYVLYFVLNILSGNFTSIKNLVENDQNALQYFVNNFSLILSLLLQNGSNLSSFYVEFGSFFVSRGMTLLGHCLFLLASVPLSELEIRPGITFSVVGANPATDKGFRSSINIMILTEIYEYCLKLSPANNISQLGFAHLLRLKVSHAAFLADNGCYAQAQKYTDYLSSVIKASGKTVKIDPTVISVLEDINCRLTDTGETGWFGTRPKLFGMIDKGFSKFIAGEDTTPATKAADGVFTNYSPSISRTQSVADFSSPGYAQSRPPYVHSNSFVGADSSTIPLSGSLDRRESNPPLSRGKYAPANYSMSGIANNTALQSLSQQPKSSAEPSQGLSLQNVGSALSLQQQSYPQTQSQSHPTQRQELRSFSDMNTLSQRPHQAAVQQQLQQEVDTYGDMSSYTQKPPQTIDTVRVPSPSLRSENNDDVRSTISKASNYSKYARVPANDAIAESNRAPYTMENDVYSQSGRTSGEFQRNYIPSQTLIEEHEKSPTQNNSETVPPPQMENISSAQDSFAAPPASRRQSLASRATSQMLSPSLPKRALDYGTPHPAADLSQDIGNASHGVADESHLDVYGETPSKPRPTQQKAPSPLPANPYASLTAAKPKRSNRYAPPGNAGQNGAIKSLAESGTAQASIDAMTSGEIDIYSYGGYSRPSPSAILTQEPKVSNSVEANVNRNATSASNFSPYGSGPGSGTVDDQPKQNFSHETSVSPSSNFMPYQSSYGAPSQSLSPRIPSEFDDDYNDDVVEDDDDDVDSEAQKKAEAVAAAAAAAKAEAEKRIEEEKLATKRKQAEAEKQQKESGKSGWFGGMFGRSGNKEDKKVYKAKLGEQSNFHYDEKLKRWVNGDSAGDADDSGTPPPPPPTIKIPKKPSDTPAPPSAKGSSAAAPPPPSGYASPATVSAPASNFSTPPPPGGKPQPSRKSTPGDIDDILNMASSARSTTKGKRGPRRGYVDVMNP